MKTLPVSPAIPPFFPAAMLLKLILEFFPIAT
ncbi:MAG: hypothetical protein H6Q68_3212 [Firmicutes bacterium]|nr:hypothetical protein [Bacillota bacterium]